MQYNLSGQDFRSNNNYPKRPMKSSIWENIWLRFWAPFFCRVFLGSIVDECCPLCQCCPTPCHWLPVSALACLLPVDESCNFLPFLKDFPPRQLSRRQESGTGPEPWGTLAMAFKQLPFSASETALPCETLIHDRHMGREIIVYISDTVEMRLLSTTGTCPGGRQYRSTPKPWDWRKIQVLITIRE